MLHVCDALGTRNVPNAQQPNDFDFVSAFGPTLYIFVFMLLFPVFLEALVHEKENKIREVMKMVRSFSYPPYSRS